LTWEANRGRCSPRRREPARLNSRWGAPCRGGEVPGDRGAAGADRGAVDQRFRGDVQRAGVNARPPGMAPNRDIGCEVIAAHAVSLTKERRNLTDHVTPHHQDDGLFRTAGQATAGQADERQLTSDVTGVRPMPRPSRHLFQYAVNRKSAEHQRPTTQRDEAAMRSLRFPFDEENCR
jgi:hypothetical protein